MTATAIKPEITKVAEQYFDDHKAEFIQGLAERIQYGIEQAEDQKAKGQFMDFASFKDKVNAIDLTK